jgi:hypothetical protein
VRSPVATLDEPMVFGDSSFTLGCSLKLAGLVPRGFGPELSALVDTMNIFPDPNTWSVRLRQVLVPLNEHDADLLHRALERSMQPPNAYMAQYISFTARHVDDR